MTYIVHRTGIFTRDYVMFTTMGSVTRIRTKGNTRTLAVKDARELYGDLLKRGYAKGPAR